MHQPLQIFMTTVCPSFLFVTIKRHEDSFNGYGVATIGDKDRQTSDTNSFLRNYLANAPKVVL
jgi:hypothetical protein